ncbi:MAG: Inorganic pyrophosphatase [Oscillospiraceae bacterium]|nr:Inorganic pyrophosphatase [Oscillospiraceae bacterium]
MPENELLKKLGEVVKINLDDSGNHSVLGNPAKIIGHTASMGRIIAVYKDTFVVCGENEIFYEPQIKEFLKIPQNEKIKCFYEKTCGAVIYTNHEGMRKYFIIKNESGHIGFPKGHIELGENEEETAKREVYEETGIEISIKNGFRMEYTYKTFDNTCKKCVYFLSHYEYKPAKVQESEIFQSWLVPFDEAVRLLNFEQDREILKEAENFIGN